MITGTQKANSYYLAKGKRYFKITCILLGFFITIFMVSYCIPERWVIKPIYNIVNFFLGLAAFLLYVFTPMAIINILKSYLHKEPYDRHKLFYLIAIITIAAFLIWLLYTIISAAIHH